MTIPKRTSEIIEEQNAHYAIDWGKDLEEAGAIGLTGLAVAQLGADPVFDTAATTADAAAFGGAAVEDAGATAVEDTAATSTADAASSSTPSTMDQGYSGTASSTADTEETSPSLWSKAKGLPQKGVQWVQDSASAALKKVPSAATGYLVGQAKSHLGLGGTSGTGTSSSGPSIYTTDNSGVDRVGPMQASKQASPAMEMEILNAVKDVPKLLEMILENLCACGQPTPGKFNGMPHCIPGQGCSQSVAFSPTNPTGDACCSCGNPNCSGSFHGQPVCAPGQGCNDHWDANKGARKWNPAMETPVEKIADHDNWASQTNHGEFEMPEESKTTWE